MYGNCIPIFLISVKIWWVNNTFQATSYLENWKCSRGKIFEWQNAGNETLEAKYHEPLKAVKYISVTNVTLYINTTSSWVIHSM